MNKVCKSCKIEKNENEYYKSQKWLNNDCINCIKAKSKTYRRSLKKSLPKPCYIYLIINPAWPDYVKLGRSKDLDNRLIGYQVGSPFRDYSIYYSKYINDVEVVEDYFTQNLNPTCVKNEWFKIDKDEAVKIIESLI